MRLTRRNALIGLGTGVAGAGVITGTGAFTSVSAERSVSVNTAGDASAALKIEPTTMGEEYLTDNSDNGALSIDLGSGNGLNMNAKTVISPLLQITNNASAGSTDIKVTSGSINNSGENAANGEAYDGIGYAVSNNPRAVMTFFVGPQESPELETDYNPEPDNGYVDGTTVNSEGRDGVEITSGESTVMSVIVDTRDLVSDASKDPGSYSDSITVIADG
jgi:hypothetical protein